MFKCQKPNQNNTLIVKPTYYAVALGNCTGSSLNAGQDENHVNITFIIPKFELNSYLFDHR